MEMSGEWPEYGCAIRLTQALLERRFVEHIALALLIIDTHMRESVDSPGQIAVGLVLSDL